MNTTAAVQPDLPWCRTSPPHPMLVVCYWLIMVVWVVNITLGSYGTYKICKMDKMNIFSILFVIISVLWIVSPPGIAFGFQSGIFELHENISF